MAMSLVQELRKLRTLRGKRDRAKEKFDEAEAEFKSQQTHVFELMQANEVGSMKQGDTLFVPAETPYAQVQDREAFVAWAKEQMPELVEEKERKAVLNELIRERLDNGEELPPGVGFYVREYVSQRAA